MYIRLSKGLTEYKLIPETEDVQKIIDDNRSQDYYTSIFKYNENQYNQWKTSGTVSGIKDVVTDKLVFDFDDKNNADNAKQDTITTIARLTQRGIPQEAIQIAWSGSKGFSIEVDINKQLSVEEFKNITQNIASDLPTFDRVVSDPQRIFRVVGTKHKSGMYKFPISVNQLIELSIPQIKTLAQDLANVDHNVFEGWKRVNLPDAFISLSKPKEKDLFTETQLVKFNLENKPHWLTPAMYALQEGFFTEGQRSNALMILAARYKHQGFNKEICYRMLKGVCEVQSTRNDMDRFPDKELYNNIVDVVYSSNWKGGQYSKDHPFLVNVAKTMNLNIKDEDVNTVIEIGDIHKEFLEYSKNFEQNIVTTGISELDKNVMFLTSTHNGLLGQPGCHAIDTGILMYDGSIKKVQDIIVGDLLMGPDSNPREVLKLQRGKDTMVKIKPLRSESFIVNQHHILNLTPSKFKQKKTLNFDLHIMVKDYIKSSQAKGVINGYKLLKTGVDFERKDLTIPPYILGLWLGDGHSNQPTLTSMDLEIVDTWTNYAHSQGMQIRIQEYTASNKAKGYSITTGLQGGRYDRNIVTNELHAMEVINNKHIPNIYKTSSWDQRAALLAGLIDTDGALEANGCGWEITQKNKTLAYDIVYIARSLGFHASIIEVKKYCYYKGEKREGLYQRIYISGKNITKVPVQLIRKQVREPINTNALHQGFTYEILGEDNYYGFTLDKDHLYLTEDFFIHHNSGKTSFALQWLEHISSINSSALFYSLDMAKAIIYANMIKRVKPVGFKEAMRLFKNGDKEALAIADQVQRRFNNVKFSFKTGSSPQSIRDDIMRHEDTTGIKTKLLIIDYLECLAGPYSDATANTGYISNQLKDLASELGLCSVILLQTQKHGGDISDPLESMKRIKGSSVIEQSSSVVLTAWREGYNPSTISQDKFMSFAAVKNRFGPLWRDDFYWKGSTGHIWNIDEIGRDDIEKLRQEKAFTRAKQLQESGGF